MARCLLLDSGVLKMMWGRIRNLVVRQREEKRPTRLMRGTKHELSISELSFLVWQFWWGSGTETSIILNPRHCKENLWVTLKDSTDTDVSAQHAQGGGSSSWDSQNVWSGLNLWQYRDAWPTGWGVTATADLAPKWWSSKRWQPRAAWHIYIYKRRMAWRREPEHTRNNSEMRCLGCWGSSTRWRLQQEGVSETRSQWKTVTHWTSHSQTKLTSLERHLSKRTGQSTDHAEEQGLIRSFLEKSGPIFLWLRMTIWNPKQSTNPNKVIIGTSGTGNAERGQGTPRH